MSEIRRVSEVVATRCAVCGGTKGPSNHWLEIGVVRTNGSGVVAVVVGSALERVLRSVEWPAALEIHATCGQQHFHQHLDNLLGNKRAAIFAPTGVTVIDPVAAAVAVAKDAVGELRDLKR